MTGFAGFEMPVEYAGINTEHMAVREAAGLFDVSHMGEIRVKGPQSLPFLRWTLSNDASLLSEGRAQYSCLPNGKGGIVDDLIVHKTGHDDYLLVVNAANVEKDWRWLNEQNHTGAELINESHRYSQLALQGPRATKILQKITTLKLDTIQPFSFQPAQVARFSGVIVAATGYTGSGGYELYIDHPYPADLWDALMEAGSSEGMLPVGLAARDTLRLEMGYCLYGNDINDQTSPIEAGLGWITRFTDDRDFIDKKFLHQQKLNGTNRKLVGFVMKERAIPRQHYAVICNERKVGEVTSGTMSPALKMGIGMAYVESELASPGKEIYIQIRDKLLRAEVVKMPFYKGNQSPIVN